MSRWDELFDDLEGRWAEAARAEELGSVPDRVRRDRASIDLAARLTGCLGQPVEVRLPGGVDVSGLVDEVGDGWVRLTEEGGACVIRLAAVTTLVGLGRAVRPGTVASRSPVAAALRDLARDRRPVRLSDVDGCVHEGVLMAVGADHVDLALLPVDVAPRRSSRARVVTVPLAALGSVRQG
ncbi:hypothetical protein [Arsenicicoccus sp. oral taxon 190]|uniref:hypothetical protein n=1 Tax=Arsenicicoccus sp. oral taxon 190 TaxID=1658671 RepID=UPI00067A1332|nr:hypothetical protein [Arsenicicoccus sp. oral taxon 190]AKT51435.1 hypothetical protein ADJ73_09115 [Arsenicicoccus sp. oral taxon 190]